MKRREGLVVTVVVGVTAACGSARGAGDNGARSSRTPQAAAVRAPPPTGPSSTANSTEVVPSTIVVAAPVAADDPSGLAAQITEAERAIHWQVYYAGRLLPEGSSS